MPSSKHYRHKTKNKI